jgi:hypothetical protein
MTEKSADQIVAEVQTAPLDTDSGADFNTNLQSIESTRLRNGARDAGDAAVGVLDTLQSIGSIPLAVLPQYELADAARNSQILDQLRSEQYLRERAEDHDAVQRATEEGGEWAGLVESAKRAATGGNTFADVMAQSPYLLIGPAAKATGFAAKAAVKGILGRGLAAIGGDSTAAIGTRVATIAATLEGTSSYGQTYERVLRETGDVEEATRQAQIAGGTALAAGFLLNKLTPGFEIDPLGRTNKVASQFLGAAVLPTAGAVAGEVVEEGGMALTNQVTDNIVNGRDPMQGVGGAVGEAAAISALFTGGLRSPALVRDVSSAIGLGVVKGIGLAAAPLANRAKTPEGQSTKAAQDLNAAAKADATIKAALNPKGGDPASTGTSEDNTTQPRESASISDEDQLEADEAYQLRQGRRTAPVVKDSAADQVLTLSEIEDRAVGDDSLESAAAAEQAATLESTIEPAIQEVFDFSEKPGKVAETVAAANEGNAAAQEQVEAIAAVNPLALPTGTFPKPLQPMVRELRAADEEDKKQDKQLSDGTRRTRDQMLTSGWANAATGKRNTRRRGMTDYVGAILGGLASGGAKDSDIPTKQSITAATFLQHIQERGALFANALKLADEIQQQGNTHPLWQQTIDDGNALIIEGTQTLDENGNLTDKPFVFYLSGPKSANSRTVVEAAVEDVISAEKKWDIFHRQFPRMATAAAAKAELQREKVRNIMAFRKGLKAAKAAQAAKAEMTPEAIEAAAINEILKTTDINRVLDLNDAVKQRVADKKLSKEAAERIQKVYDAQVQKLISEKIQDADTLEDLETVAKKIKGLGDQVSDSVKAALRKEWKNRQELLQEQLEETILDTLGKVQDEKKLPAIAKRILANRRFLRPEQLVKARTAFRNARRDIARAKKEEAAEKAKAKAATPPPPPSAPATPAPTASASATAKKAPKLTSVVLRIARLREDIKQMLPNIRWDQVGGESLFDSNGKFLGRTTWIPNAAIADWWSRDLGLSMEKTQALFQKLADGTYSPKQLQNSKNQMAVLTAYLEWMEENLGLNGEEETDGQTSEDGLAGENTPEEPAGVSDTGADSNTGQESAPKPQGSNPLSQITNWFGNVLEYFNIDPNNTLEGWVEKFRAVTTPDGKNVYDTLYAGGVEETYQLLESIVHGNEGIGTWAGKGELDKAHAVGSYVWVPVGETTYTDENENVVTRPIYRVPEPILRAFAVAGVIALYRNAVSFKEIMTEDDVLSREVQKEAVAAEIGRTAMKLLGITGKNSTSITIDQGVFLSYGLSTVAALIAGQNFEMNFTPDPPINVWHGSNEHSELSNLALRPFEYEGRQYFSVEHAYQTLKSGEFNERVYNNPAWKKAGTKINGGQAKTDGNFNISLMKALMKASFESNKEAAAALVATKSAPITHNQDRGIWRTEFPRLLMEVRAELPGYENPWTNANLKTVIASLSNDLADSMTEDGQMSPRQIIVPTQPLLKIAKQNDDSIDKVQGVLEAERIWEVGNEPITEIDATVQYDNTRLSEHQQTAQGNLQAVDHRLFPGFHNFIKAVGENGLFSLTTGWWEDMPADDDFRVPETVRRWLSTQRTRLTHESRVIQKYLEVTENGVKGLFYKYHFGLNGRPKSVNGPQNLKIVRDLFSSGKAVLNLKNTKHKRAINMTLAQAFGVKTDINSPDEVIAIWNGKGPKGRDFAPKKAQFLKAAEAVKAARKADGTFDRAALLSALKQDKPYTPRQLAAIITWSEMLENPENTEFTSYLMFEIDGKTNGAFNTELFFGLAVHNYANLAQGGFFPKKHDATWATEREELIRQAGGLDFYERLNNVAEFQFVREMRIQISEDKRARNDYLNYLRLLEAADLVEVEWNTTSWEKTYKPSPDSAEEVIKITNFPKFTFKRDAAKFAIIPIQYGGGASGIANQLWSDVIQRINANWIAKYNKARRTTDKAEHKQLVSEMENLAGILLGWNTRGRNLQKLPPDEKSDAWRWRNALYALAKSMSKAYALEKPIVQRLTNNIIQATQFAYAVKKYQWDLAVEKIKAEMPENKALIAKYGKGVRLFEPSTEQLREAMKDSISMRFSVLNAPDSVNLNQTEWKTGGVDVTGVGTPMNANMDVPTLADPGVSILALMTIAGGDAAMGNILFQVLRQVTHVFDGYDINPLQIEEVGEALNKGVWGTAMFNILADVGTLYNKIEYVVGESSNEAITKMAENYNAVLPEGMAQMTPQTFVTSLAAAIADFETLYRNQRVGQQILASQENTVYQMGGSGKGYNTPVRSSAALDDEFQLSLEEDAGRQEVVDLSEVGTREEGLFPKQYKDPDATRFEDKDGLIDVVMKGPRWRGTNTYTPPTAEAETWLRDGLSHGLRRLVKVLHMAANAGVPYDTDQSMSPDALKMYLRGKRAGIITWDSTYSDKDLEDAINSGRGLRTTDAQTYTGPSILTNVRLVGRAAVTDVRSNPTIQSAFDLADNRLNKTNVIAALDNVKWKNPIHRAVWKRIRNLLPDNLMVYLATTPEQWLDASRITNTRRVFNSVTGFAVGSTVVLRVPSAETMLHELLHTIFTKHIDNFFSNINLVPVELRGPINDLVQLMEKFKKLPAVGRVGFIQKVMRSYAFRGQPQDELGEMLAYVFTEERVIEELSPGFISRVLTRVKQILRYITGLPANTKDFYNEAMDVFRQLTDNVPQSADIVDRGSVRVSDRLADDPLSDLESMTDQVYETLVLRSGHGANIDFTNFKKEVDVAVLAAGSVYALNVKQDEMFRRIYGLIRYGNRSAELEKFVSSTFPQHPQKNLFNKVHDVTAAVLALATVEPTFAAQLDALWNARAEDSKVDQLIDRALNESQQNSSKVMVTNAVAAMMVETEARQSFYATVTSRLDRIGSNIINRLGELSFRASEKAPDFIDDGLFIIGALLNEKRASAFGEDLLGFVNTKWKSQAVRDNIAALLGTKGSGKAIYRAHEAMMTLINQTRSMFDNTLPRELAKLFPKDFDGWSRLYYSFGNLDVAALPPEDVERMYRDDAERRRIIEVLKLKVDNWVDAENLGYFLVHHDVKPDTTLNLLRNAHAIASNLNGAKRKPSDAQIADADQLATLFAIEALSASERATVASYYDKHRDSMNKLVGMLKHIKDTEKSNSHKQYDNVTWKVSLPLSTDPRSSTVIGNSIKGATLETLGYIKGEKYPQSSGDPENDLYYYHRKYSPPPVFTQGIIATVQATMQGINLTTAASITPEVGTMLASPQAIAYINRHKGRGSKLIPIYNLKGDIIGYERLLNPAIVRKQLGAEGTMLHVSIGKKLGRITEETLAKEINKAAMQLMYDQWKADEEKGREKEYEAINSTTDKQVARAWENIPGPIKAQLEEIFYGQVMVRRDLLSNTIGYHNAGVLEIYTGDASLDPKTRKILLGLLQTVFFGPKGTQFLLGAEQAIKEGVATAKDLIIVRSLVVAWQNLLASGHMVIANGVPPAKVIKYYREGMADVRSYNRLQREVMQLRIQIAGTTDTTEQERLRALQLTKRNAIKRLRIAPLIEAGMLSDLPEGLEESPSHSYLGDLAGWMNNHLRRVHPKAPAAMANAIFAKDSAIHDALSKTIQAGDFLARYAIYQHMVEQGTNPEKAVDEVRDELVSYQTNPGRMRAALETYGMIWWSQFTIRAQNVLLNRFRKNPFSFFVSQAMGDFVGTPGPLDGAITERGLDNSLGLDQVFTSPTAHIYAKVF